MAPTDDKHTVSPETLRRLAVIAAAATVILTAVAFWLSYEHLHDVAQRYGLSGAAAAVWRDRRVLARRRGMRSRVHLARWPQWNQAQGRDPRRVGRGRAEHPYAGKGRTVTRRPNLARACHQLDRHRSGTPNTPPPVRPSWAVNLAAFNAANSVSSAKILAGLPSWSWGASSKQETA